MKPNYFFRFFIIGVLLFSSASFYRAQAQCSVSAGNDTTIFYGYAPLGCITITATNSGISPFTYSWDNGAVTASITVCDTAATTYVVTATDSAGCIATDTITVFVSDIRCGSNKVLVCHIPPGNPANAHTICISANAVPAHLAHGCVLGGCIPPPPPPPTCSINLGSDITVCNGGPVLLDAGSAFITYTWADGSTAQTFSATASGSFSVTGVDSAGCTATDTIEVTIFTGPIADAGADTTLTDTTCYTLNGGAAGGTTPYSFAWSTGDSTASAIVCDSVTAEYVLIVTDSNGCTATDTVTIVFPSGQRIMQSGFIFSLPNPFSERTRVEFRLYARGQARVEILNLTGYRVAVLFDGEAEAFTPYIVNFNAAELPGGVYFARVTTGNLPPVVHKMTLLNE